MLRLVQETETPIALGRPRGVRVLPRELLKPEPRARVFGRIKKLKDMFNEERYKEKLEALGTSKNFVEQLPVLNCILNTVYWRRVKKQLEAFRKDRSGFINPIFHLVLEKDKSNNFVKAKQLDEYLSLIFGHPEIKQKDKNYIKKELQSFDRINSINMLYEVNVIGYLLTQFSADKICIYPRNVLKRNTDVKISFIERDIYIEITALGDSDFTIGSITNVLKSSKRFSSLPSSDEEKDIRRIRSRLEEKEKQFIPQKPNVLIIFMVGVGAESISAFGLLKKAIEQSTLKNIGLIMEFDRQELIGLHQDGCDDACFLTGAEEARIRGLFSPERFKTLVY